MACYSDSKVIREYLSDDSFLTRPDIFQDVTQYQLCLAFAIDEHKNGNFTPGWNTEKINPDVIQDFKLNCHTAGLAVKVLVSIGDGAFNVLGGVDDWVLHAQTTLHDIIKKYHLDGIDVSYSKILCNKDMFVTCIHKLISGLSQTIGTAKFEASIAPNADTNEGFYLPLYQSVSEGWIRTVVFQCYVDFQPQDPSDPVKSLVNLVQNTVVSHYYASEILLGYSALENDWTKVSPPLFFLTLNSLVCNSRLHGASVKVISDTRASIPGTWIPQLLSLAVSDAHAIRNKA